MCVTFTVGRAVGVKIGRRSSTRRAWKSGGMVFGPCSSAPPPRARSPSLVVFFIYVTTLLSVVAANEAADARNDVIEGGISVERCAESNVLGIYSGAFLLPDVYKVEQSTYDCCGLCVEASKCVAWDYCTRPEGCKPPEGLVKQQSPLQKEVIEIVIPVNGTTPSASGSRDEPNENSRVPYGACVLTTRLLSAEVAATKEYGGAGERFGFFSGTVERLFLPYLNGYNVTDGMDIPAEYDFPCGYSPRKQRCEILGTIPEVAAICSADPRCKGFVYSESEGMGVLKGGDGSNLFSGEEFYDSDGIVYALTASGQQAQQGAVGGLAPSPSSSPSNLWIILISVLGGVAILSIAAVTITMFVLGQRYDKLQKSSDSYVMSLHEGMGPMDFDGTDGVDGDAALENAVDRKVNGQDPTAARRTEDA